MAAFINRQALERWLGDRSPAEARALAVRSALRAAPALRTAICPSMVGLDQPVDGARLYFSFAAKGWSGVDSHDTLNVDGVIAAKSSQLSVDLEIYAEKAQAAFQARTWDFVAAACAASAFRYAAAISAAVKSDDIRLAVDATGEAATAASLAVNAFQPYLAAAEMVFTACAADATILEGGASAGQLLEQPLWPGGTPTWVKPNWAMVRCHLPLQNRRRAAWVRWYERRLRGDASHPSRSLESCLDDLTLEAAAIEPVWLGDHLTLADQPPHSQLGEETMRATLGALREEMADLADDTALLPNCDPRPSQYLSRLAQRIPSERPSQLYLFRLGNSRDSAHDFLPIVEREWPDLFVSRFRATLLQFDRTLGQFPKYRPYEDYRRRDALTETQMELASAVSKVVAETLENEGAKAWLDPAIASALRTLEEPIALADGQANLTPSIVSNLLESISNILKALLDGAIKRLGPVVHWTKSTAIECRNKFAEGLRAGLVDQAGKAGDRVGRSVGAILKGLGAAMIVSGGLAAAPFMTVLTQEFSAVFGWLKSFLRFIGKL